MSKFSAWIYVLNRWYCRWWQRLPAGYTHLPEGPLILVGNHRSGVDPLLIQAAVDRPLRFLMSREYYNGMWYLRWFFDLFGAIPVRPGGVNRQALSVAGEVLRQGEVLCIFPEGGANPKIPLKHILPGAVMLSMETEAPILPFRVTGVWPFDQRHLLRQFLQRGRARVSLGTVMNLSPHAASRADIRYWTDEMKKSLLALAVRPEITRR